MNEEQVKQDVANAQKTAGTVEHTVEGFAARQAIWIARNPTMTFWLGLTAFAGGFILGRML